MPAVETKMPAVETKVFAVETKVSAVETKVSTDETKVSSEETLVSKEGTVWNFSFTKNRYWNFLPLNAFPSQIENGSILKAIPLAYRVIPGFRLFYFLYILNKGERLFLMDFAGFAVFTAFTFRCIDWGISLYCIDCFAVMGIWRCRSIIWERVIFGST